MAILEPAPEDESGGNSRLTAGALAAHNQYLTQILGQLENALAFLGGTTFAIDSRPATAVAEHRAIVDAISARDPYAAETAGRAHIAAA